MKINYLEILKNAWKITWENRYLWWFGLFIALSGGGGMNYFSQNEKWGKSSSIKGEQVTNFIFQNIYWIATLLIIIFLLLILFLVIGIIGRGALIASIEKNSKRKASDFRTGWKEGKKNFWKIFNLNIALGIFIFFTLAVLVSPVTILMLNGNYIIGGILTFLAVLIFIPLAILVSYLKTYSYLYAILGKLKFWPALENAYKLFARNILSSILMSLIFIPISILIFLTVFVSLLVLLFIFLISGGISYLIFGKILAIIVGGIGVAIFLAYLLFIRSVYEVFSQSVWILFFREIASPKIPEAVPEKEKEIETMIKPLPVIESKKEN